MTSPSTEGDDASAPSATHLATAAIVLCFVGGSAAAGWIDLSLVDVVVLLGVAIVLPLALGGGWEWVVAAVAAGASLALPVGPIAAAPAAVWFVVAARATVHTVGLAARQPSVREVASGAARAFALVAAGAFLASRLGLRPFGVGEPIVELTAVHFTYAGSASSMLAVKALEHVSGRWARVGRCAVTMTVAAPAIVATGFVTRSALAQVGGAVAMAVGVWCTATLELHLATTGPRSRAERLLLFVSGAAIWLPMVLAVAWAAGQHGDFPALSIPAMERTHGVANALGFVVAGLLAWWLRSPADPRRRRARVIGASRMPA